MSAFVVSKTHVDLLVRASLHGSRGAGQRFQWWQVDAEGSYAGWRVLDECATGEDEARMSPSQAGQLLVSENVASVSYRYPGDDVEGGELPGPCDAFYIAPYVYSDPGYTLTPGEVFKAIDCLDYQSCEHPGWRTSEAFAFLASLRDAYCCKVEGYGSAPWEFDSSDLDGRTLNFARRVI